VTRDTARSHDDPPYDRDLIRSGSASRRGERRNEARPPRAAASRRSGRARRGRSLLRTIRNVLLLALLAVIVGGVLLGMRAAAFNATVSSATFPSTQLLGPLNGSDRVNVLMVGYGGPGHDGAYLADSIQILSIDPKTNTTVTIPIPRDLWIEGIAALPQNGKVNEVFAQGYINGDESLDTAGALMVDVLSTVTGLEIHHWLSIDFTGFRDMVDAVGGVTIDNPVAFSYTTNEQVHLAGNWNTGHFDMGEIHLDGKQALAYSRARYTSVVSESTDFARSVRQARILAALRSSVGDGGVGAIGPGLGLMDAMEGRVRTDMSVIDLFLLSSHLTSERRVELSEGPVLTATTNTDGQYILIPSGWTGPGDYAGIHQYLADELARAPEPSPSATDAP
jgi:LCP family protein required for cell wall assembly